MSSIYSIFYSFASNNNWCFGFSIKKSANQKKDTKNPSFWLAEIFARNSFGKLQKNQDRVIFENLKFLKIIIARIIIYNIKWNYFAKLSNLSNHCNLKFSKLIFSRITRFLSFRQNELEKLKIKNSANQSRDTKFLVSDWL
jgi:hypothetical protein